MQGTEFTLARLKIVHTIKNLCHIQCQCVDELRSSARLKLQHPFSDSYQPSRPHVDPGFYPLAFENLQQSSSSVTNPAYLWRVF